MIDWAPVRPPSIDNVYAESIRVCAPLEMSDRYRFHSFGRPRLKPSDANDPRAGGQQSARRESLSVECSRNASEDLFDGRGQRVVIGIKDEDSEQLRGLGLARVAADRMDSARRF